MRSFDPTAPEALTESLVISASAGSGKTFTLSVLVLATLGQGELRPFEILATTFSEASAADLRERLLRPLDLLVSLPASQWETLLPPIVAYDPEALGTALGRLPLPESLRKAGEELRWAAAHWGAAPWVSSPEAARSFWRRVRREAELMPVSTLHGLALSLLRLGPGAPEAVVDAAHPALLRLLRQAAREVIEVPEAHPDHAPGRVLLAWARSHWADLSAGHDGHRDALGHLQVQDLSPLHAALEGALAQAERALAPFARHPASAKEETSPQRHRFKASQVRPLPAAGAPLGARIAWAEAQSRAATDAAGGMKTYHTAAFHEAIRTLEGVAHAWESLLSALLGNALVRFEALKRAHGQATFGDLVRTATVGLQEGALAAPKPRLLLVDECQDTSASQDAFLAALQPQRVVRVGDLKQAIYGFRGGDPDLLRGHLRAAGDRAFRLPSNFRSAEPVVRLANTYVEALWPRLVPGTQGLEGGQVPAHAGGAPVALARSETSDRHPDLPLLAPWIQALSREEGWARILGPASSDRPRRRALLLKQRTRLPALLRKLKAAGLRPYVLAKEGFWESPGVRVVMAALEAVAHPDRTLPCAVLLRHGLGLSDGELTALGRSGGLPGLGRLDPEALPEPARAAAKGLVGLLGASAQEIAGHLLGQGELLRFLSSQRAHGEAEPHRARRNLSGLLALLLTLPASPATAFALLEELRGGVDKGDLPAQSEAADLIIQTVHGSKGLEYEDVILPLLNAPPKGLSKGTVMTDPEGTLRFVWKLGHHKGPAYLALAPELERRQRQDDLNLFYVGLTRARERLCLLLQEPAPRIPKPKGKKAVEAVEEAPAPPEVATAATWSALGRHLVDLHADVLALDAPPALTPPSAPPPPDVQPPIPRDPWRAAEPAHTGEPEARARAQARQDGERVHAYLQDLLMRWEDPEAFQARLEAPPLPGAKEQALRFLAQFEARGWRRLRRRTEYPLPGAAATGAQGYADLVVWESESRIQLLDFKYSSGFSDEDLEVYRKQLSRYAEVLGVSGAEVRATLVAVKSGEWVGV